MAAPPFMRLWIGDYLLDTMHLTRDQHGAYLLLLMAMFRADGKLPANDVKLAQISKCTPAEWTEIRPLMLAFFRRRGSVLTHKRITVELLQYRASVNAAKNAGLASAAKRARKNNGLGSTDVDFAFNENPTNQNQNQNQKEREERGRARGTRLPPDWSPSDIDRAYARTHGLGDILIDRAAEKFRNYWHAKAGASSRKVDWPATWRNWILADVERKGAEVIDPARRAMLSNIQ